MSQRPPTEAPDSPPSDEAQAPPPESPLREPGGAKRNLRSMSWANDVPEIPLEALDRDALAVIHRLRTFGHQAYLVGGCVRDLLLGGSPKDYDVATSAHPGEIRAIFRNCRLIGRRFRLAHVYFAGGKIVETATFRANPLPDEANGDLLITRDNVFGTAEEDARRRDFTINGLFYDVVLGRVIDYVGGREDLALRRIRTIGDPDVRMQEDPVRLLRAVRFSAKLGLEIDGPTWEAMKRYKGELARCAPPRVLEEIFRLLRSGASRRCFELLHQLDALRVLLPPLAQHLDAGNGEQAAVVFRSLAELDEVVRTDGVPDDSVLLAVLASHLAAPLKVEAEANGVDEEPEEEEEEVAAEAAPEEEPESPLVPWSDSAAAAQSPEDLLAALSRTARLPRRVAERSRQLLRALRVLTGAQQRRRKSAARLLRQEFFPDALTLLRIHVRAVGEGEEQLARWEERAIDAGVIAPKKEDEPAEVAEHTAEEPKERRRGRRGRRSKGATAEASSQDREESLPPPAERLPPEGPANLLPF